MKLRISARAALALSVLSVFLAGLCPSQAAAQAGPAYAWVEAEEPASMNFEDYWTGSERAHLLSDGRLFGARFQGRAVEELPDEGYVLSYQVDVPEDGVYDAWARVGMEWIRAPFEWRIGEGEWRAGAADVATTNVMELAHYNEIAWLALGEIALEAGPAVLTVRYTETPPNRNDIFAVLDCFAFVDADADWLPAGPLKPGQSYDAEIDRRAAAHIFELPAREPGARRSSVVLSGPWEIARWDDTDMDDHPWEPETELPDLERLAWRGIEVPKSQWNVDGLNLAHRTVYRTRVRVPGGDARRGFKLHFSGTNWLVSVFVNGRLAGTHKGVWIPWDMDISDHVTAGELNTIALVIKGPWYAIDYPNYRSGGLMKTRNIPIGNARGVRWVAPIYPSTKGDGDGRHYGIVNPVTMVAVGDAYTEDVFVRPQGRGTRPDRLEADVTLRNTGDTARNLQVQCAAVYDQTGEVEREFEPLEITVPAGGTVTRTAEVRNWRDPKLWWPEPDPHLYRLRTTISEAGEVLDVHEQLFGYRWITIRDRGVYINGVRFNTWNWVGVSGSPQNGEEWLAAFRGERNRFTRFSANRKTRAFLPTREERLEFYDRNGIAGRLCSMIDGMFISYHLGAKRQSSVTGERFIEPNKALWEGWERHMAQLARAYRNHPSVIVYQVENELIYINGMNLGYPLDSMEELMGDVIDAARQVDPTRPYTVGGAGDLDCECEINAPHYPLGKLDWYPENAYTLEKIKEKLAMYPPFYNNKPWTVGESLFAHHLRYGTLALGDSAFRSARDAARGKARFLRHVYEGYRYGGAAGFYPWDNLSRFDDGIKMFSALAVIPRKLTHRLYAGRRNEILLKVMNDTLHNRPVLFEWIYEAGGETVGEGSETLRIEPGHGEERVLAIDAPETDARLEGRLTLKVSQPDVEPTEPYTDVRSIPVLPAVDALEVGDPVYVLDPSDAVPAFLEAAGQPFERIEGLAETDGRTGLLLIGPDALTPEDAFGRDILKFAAQGGRVVVLEQGNPVAGGNVPVPLNFTTHYGGYAHPQALGTRLYRDLDADDLIDWSGDHPTYKNAYEKPAKGGRSLAECGAMLERSPLIEVPIGKGVAVLCQLRVGAKLGADPAADVLLRNMIEHYAGYRPATGIAAVYAPGDPLLAESVATTGVETTMVEAVGEALDPEQFQVAVIHATDENLQALNDMADRVAAFQRAGGWIVLSGLQPEGIEGFNRLLDTDHAIRPFRLERVTLEAPQHPLAATLGNRDLAMYSPQNLQHTKDWISRNVYTYVVDAHPDVAPFTRPPGAPEDILQYEPTRNDHDPYNYVNDMLGSDHWRYIRQIWIGEGQGELPLTFEFLRPETIAKVRIWNNANYSTIEDMSVIFDGEEAEALHVVLPDEQDGFVEIELDEPRRVEQSITLRIDSWRPHRAREGGWLVGINNVEFIRAPEPGDPVCLDNVGGLVAYARGEGGFLLNQVKFMRDEPRPANADKKLNIMGTLLRNMGVGSGAGMVALPGVNIRYRPVSLLDHCTQYLARREDGGGWFGQGARDMSLLPVGEQRLADQILYHIVDYATAPVPDCIVLGVWRAPRGLPRQVEGIDVGRKGDLLFLLHTAHVHSPIWPGERERIEERGLPEVLRYVINYADGQSVEIPVLLEKHIDHWLQYGPEPLPGAQVAATVEVPGLESESTEGLQRLLYQMNAHRIGYANLPAPAPEDVKGVLYGMQVKNPRPDVVIESIDVVPGKDDRRAVPAVLGITLGDIIGGE